MQSQEQTYPFSRTGAPRKRRSRPITLSCITRSAPPPGAKLVCWRTYALSRDLRPSLTLHLRPSIYRPHGPPNQPPAPALRPRRSASKKASSTRPCPSSHPRLAQDKPYRRLQRRARSTMRSACPETLMMRWRPPRTRFAMKTMRGDPETPASRFSAPMTASARGPMRAPRRS